MFRPEDLNPAEAIAAAERILKDDRAFNGNTVVSAAEEVIDDFSKDSSAINVDLNAEMIEFLSSVCAEENLLENQSPEGENVLENVGTLAAEESASATLLSKFETITRLYERFPGTTRLTLREIRLINEQLLKVISELKEIGDKTRLKRYRGLYRSLNGAFLQAAEKDTVIKNDLIEGIIDLEKSRQ